MIWICLNCLLANNIKVIVYFKDLGEIHLQGLFYV